ncbi:hypothetical protein K504DRAFT_30984 [Pleomassaria siparia CBS 279.74]|uniref:Uncharacterized protein n=1 Tax=Pleomassaria siparia CBS 279.74 TaxID=1314801 RepID=A0A6G1KSP4_9PLEO|nr:hypothetical protein K504DRAFT_30984 [Pleomassaria siparia CBS 279.74]
MYTGENPQRRSLYPNACMYVGDTPEPHVPNTDFRFQIPDSGAPIIIIIVHISQCGSSLSLYYLSLSLSYLRTYIPELGSRKPEAGSRKPEAGFRSTSQIDVMHICTYIHIHVSHNMLVPSLSPWLHPC